MNAEDTIYITGSGGMVGRNLVEQLRTRGFTNILIPTSSQLNLMDREQVFAFFKTHKPDYVFHLAAKVSGFKTKEETPVAFLRNNLLLNVNVVDACFENSVNKLINLGSACIYPSPMSHPMKEEDLMGGQLEPANEGYALSKIAALKLCEYYNTEHGTLFISLIPPSLYGPHDHFDSETSHVVPALISRMDAAKEAGAAEFAVWGTGQVKREFLYVTDLINAMLFAIDNIDTSDLVGGFINCGSSEEVSICDLVHTIKEVVQYEGDIAFDANKPEGIKRRLIDSTRLNNLGFTPQTTIKEGITKTYKYYKGDTSE